MSAPLAGKFCDHYEVLGVDPKADTAAIKDAYAKLAAKYSPTNQATGDREKFAELNSSYEVLIDPELRKAFDQVKGGGNDDAEISFPVEEFLADLDADAGRRNCLLALLYYRRKYHSISPGISLRHIEGLMKVTSEQLAFITWVLKQRGLVTADDKSRLLVTVNGIEYVERLGLTAEQVLPWLRSVEVTPKALAAAEETPVATVPAAVPATAEAVPVEAARPGLSNSGLSSLRSALQKSMGLPVRPDGAREAGAAGEKPGVR